MKIISQSIKAVYLLLFVTIISCDQKNNLSLTTAPESKDTIAALAIETPIEYITPIDSSLYKVRCNPLCEDEKGKLVPYDTVVKYGKHRPYNITSKNKLDSAIMRFDFITDCCGSFTGNISVESDTLYLGYFPDRDSMNHCDCYCDYRIVYRLKSTGLNWSALKIIHGKPSRINSP